MIDQLEMFATGATPYSVRTVTREQHVHQNSAKCYHESRHELSKRAEEVLSCYRGMKQPLTDRQVKEMLGYSDSNAVRPRVTEMIDMGILREVGKTVDTVTGKTVRLVEMV
jgi:chromosome segregation and condensation protein ScpB